MPNLPYKSSGWDTHSEVKLREVDWPLSEQEPLHFTVKRTYEGPLDTYRSLPLDAVDAVFTGVAVTGVVAEADDESLTFASAHGLFTGCPITVAAVSGMTGVSAGSFFAIRISATVIKLASTLAGAYAGTAAAFSADGTCDITAPAAYFVRQGPLIDVDGGAVRYERLFATLPASWSEPEEFPFTFPGYEAGAAGAAKGVNSLTASGGNLILGLSVSGDAVAGDAVFVSVTYTRGGGVHSAQFSAVAVATTNSSQVTVGRTLPGSGAFSSVSGSVSKFATGVPAARSLVVGSRVVHDYALSSPTALDSALPLAPLFAPIDAEGAQASLLTATTLPTAASYRTLVQDRAELVAESVRRRYLGNLFVRKTRLVPAQ